jgi:dipeptidyl aminopeptidase/acylaminoacyl peptidase
MQYRSSKRFGRSRQSRDCHRKRIICFRIVCDLSLMQDWHGLHKCAGSFLIFISGRFLLLSKMENTDKPMTSNRIALEVDGLTIVGEIFYPPQVQGLRPALCLCHGIPATKPVVPDSGYAELAQRFALEGFVTCAFNFRGTGESGGNLDLLGWTRDLDAIITCLIQINCVDKSRIFLMGFSGGAAASAYVAAHDERISALVLCACPAEFSTLRLDRLYDQCLTIGTIRDINPPFSLDEWRNHFLEVNPINWVDRISPRPILILHGDKDELIEVAHARRLFDKSREPKQLVLIPGGEHRLRVSETAMDTALAWLKAQG